MTEHPQDPQHAQGTQGEAQPQSPQPPEQPVQPQPGYGGQPPSGEQAGPPQFEQPQFEQSAYEQSAYGQPASSPPQYGEQYGPGYPQTGAPLTGPAPLSPADERTWSIAAHLSPFLASLVGLPFLGPLVIYLVFRDRGPFVRHHAAQALNFQIIVAIGLLISIPLMFVLVGIFTAIVIGIAAVVFQIIAAVEANNGKWYRYPLTPDWVK
jgi:uncharacterized Tic20 family protein